MKKELQIFLTAIMFYSRIPVPKKMKHEPDLLNKATRYFPLVGIITGVIAAAVFFAINYVTNVSVAVIFSMIASVLVTGAFHEDGFADVCDGFGGGWTKEKILLIMKDSRVGAYGAIGIVLLLLLKFSLLIALPVNKITMVIIAGHALSRFFPVIIMFLSNYVRENEDAKAKPLAKKIAAIEALLAFIFAALPLLLFCQWQIIGVLLMPLLFTFYINRYFKKWIGGYTGDCLGAVQQVAEVLIYLSLIILWKFI